MSQLKKLNDRNRSASNPFAGVEAEDRRAKYWDYENGRWENLTEEAIEKLWPKIEASVNARHNPAREPTEKVPQVYRDVQAFYAATARRIRGSN
jgi:hypothetical protein